MLKIEVNGKIREVPEFYYEMSVEFFSGYWKILVRHKEKDNETIEERVTRESTLTRQLVAYMLKLSDEDANEIKIEQAQNVIECINLGIGREKADKYKMNKFKWKGETYYFPADFMRNSTFGEYAELRHIEQIFMQDEHNKFDYVKKQIAILCRKKNEKYDSYDLEEREKEFEGLTMDIVMAFSFFLSSRIRNYQRDFPTFLKEESPTLSTKK